MHDAEAGNQTLHSFSAACSATEPGLTRHPQRYRQRLRDSLLRHVRQLMGEERLPLSWPGARSGSKHDVVAGSVGIRERIGGIRGACIRIIMNPDFPEIMPETRFGRMSGSVSSNGNPAEYHTPSANSLVGLAPTPET